LDGDVVVASTRLHLCRQSTARLLVRELDVFALALLPAFRRYVACEVPGAQARDDLEVRCAHEDLVRERLPDLVLLLERAEPRFVPVFV
jgi:hypothetical protein